MTAVDIIQTYAKLSLKRYHTFHIYGKVISFLSSRHNQSLITSQGIHMATIFVLHIHESEISSPTIHIY